MRSTLAKIAIAAQRAGIVPLLRPVLEHQGHEVTVIEGGKILSQAASVEYDLLILDKALPSLQSPSFAQSVRDRVKLCLVDFDELRLPDHQLRPDEKNLILLLKLLPNLLAITTQDEPVALASS